MIEIEIIVRQRDEHMNPVGKPGHETVRVELLDRLPLADRKRVALRVAQFARMELMELLRAND